MLSNESYNLGVSVGGRETFMDLFELDMVDFDVILGWTGCTCAMRF